MYRDDRVLRVMLVIDSGIGAWSLFIGAALATLDNVFVVNHVRGEPRNSRGRLSGITVVR